MRELLRQALTSFVALTAVVACGRDGQGDGLKPMSGTTELSCAESARVGDIWDIGLPVTAAKAGLSLQSVAPVGLTGGLNFGGSDAYTFEESDGSVGLLKGDLAKAQPERYGHPKQVSGLALPRGSSKYYVVVKVLTTKPGASGFSAIRVSYTVDGTERHQDFAMSFVCDVH